MRLSEITTTILKHKKRFFPAIAAMQMVLSVGMTLPLYEWVTAQNYELNNETVKLVGSTNSSLVKKLTYNAETKVYEFNAQSKISDSSNPEDIAQQLRQSVTGNAEDKNLYSVDMPVDPKKGMTFYDNNSRLSFKLVPKFKKQTGRKVQDRVVYPLPDGVKAIYTLKGNGLKEDIVYESAPESGEASFAYDLVLPDTLEARLQDDGSLGIFSADPRLFGNVSYGADEDRVKLESARQSAVKDTLVFSVPRPVIVASNGDLGKSYAWFKLDQKTLTVNAKELQTIKGSFSIDPSVVITSSAEFKTGNDEGDINFGTDEIKRSPISGGSTGTHTATTNFSFLRADPNSVVYNGYIYILGGDVVDTTTNCKNNAENSRYCNDVQFAQINADGTIGTWAATTSFSFPRSTSSVAYNGYMYVVGGVKASANTDCKNTGTSQIFCNDVQFAPINANGTLGSWTTTTYFDAPRAGAEVVVYNNFMYVVSGNTGTYSPTVQFAPINANGTLGSWDFAISLASGRVGHEVVVHDGYMYVSGGQQSGTSTACKNTGANSIYCNDMQYARIFADGSVDFWTTVHFPTPRENHSVTISKGYMYISGGFNGTILSDVQYAPINSTGLIGAWSSTTGITVPRYRHSLVNYGDYLYILGGYKASNTSCNNTGATSNVCNDVLRTRVDEAGVTLPYTATTQFNNATVSQGTGTGRQDHTTVVHKGFIYVLGGIGPNTLGQLTRLTDVQYAPINADGTVGAWTTNTSSFAVARSFHTSLVYNNFIYVIGGFDTNGAAINGVQYAPINANGSIGTWTNFQQLMNNARGAHTSVLFNNKIYVLGGNSGGGGTLRTVEYASLSFDGSITTTWTLTTSFGAAGTERSAHASVLHGNRIYVIGGDKGSPSPTTTNEIISATIDSTGAVSAWTVVTSGSTAPTLHYHTAVLHNGHIYLAGGNNNGSGSTNATYVAPINLNGSIGAWLSGDTMTVSRSRHAAAVNPATGTIYINGGFDGTTGYYRSVEYANINNGGPGSMGTHTGTINLPTAREGHATVAYKGFLYMIGGFNGTFTDQVYYAPINSNGSISSWLTTTSLPLGRSDHTAVVHNGYVYVAGGEGASYYNDVYYAPINTNGTIGDWATTSSFTTARKDHTSVVYNGYIYILGGSKNTSSAACNIFTSSICNDVQYAVINANGTVGTWGTTTGFTNGRDKHASIAHNGYLYVIGGGNILNDVQYAPLNANGTIGAAGWTRTTDFNTSRRGHSVVQYNGYLYILGGDQNNSAVAACHSVASFYCSDVQYAPIHANGTVGAWTYTTSLPSARTNQAAVAYDGYLYTIGGATPTAIQNVSYSALDSISRNARYSKLIDLGSLGQISNISYTGSLPGAKSAISYRIADLTGVMSDALPATAITGACTGVDARYVWVSVELDDSTAGVQSDSLYQSSLQDITVSFLSASTMVLPNERLRTGKYFKTQLLQPLDTIKSVTPGC